MIKYVKFRILYGEKDDDGVLRRSDIRMVESNMDMRTCNELPVILNSFVGNGNLATDTKKGFIYDFPMNFG